MMLKNISKIYLNTLLGNSNITLEFILNNPDFNWEWSFISFNPNLNWNYVVNNPKLDWSYPNLSKHPNITFDIIMDKRTIIGVGEVYAKILI